MKKANLDGLEKSVLAKLPAEVKVEVWDADLNWKRHYGAVALYIDGGWHIILDNSLTLKERFAALAVIAGAISKGSSCFLTKAHLADKVRGRHSLQEAAL